MEYQQCTPTAAEARAFFELAFDRNLATLGALLFEPITLIIGVRRLGRLVAVGLVVAGEANLPDALPTVSFDANDAAALQALLADSRWPAHAIWSVDRAEYLPLVEAALGQRHDPTRGVVYFIASAPPAPHSLARRLTSSDTALDLAPCSLSAMALSYWMLRGWRVFGAVEDQRLLGHAVAAYPIGDTEEVSAVFTAPEARRRGIARACVAVAIADIQARGLRAVYVSRKHNHASIAVAKGLGMARLLQTWEIDS